ncbi:hypothetical protein CHS0354_018177 [Potamilus streckersoni]|uniref:Saposin B-type domain-containing protein n=1 Tax=Potamilus streckersoni TaxID=2493646 RepID=A0AAE0STD5_9BIVA|nr:hypothetical protein CHS0354_018177 [Potamilus streckersoni]
MEYHSLWSTVKIAFAVFLFVQSSLVSADANGGASCATCTVIVALAEQTSVIHNESIVHALDRICGYLPGTYQKACKEFVDFFGPILIDILMEDDTPDSVCHKLSFCFTQSGKQECSLFPKKAYGFKSRKIRFTRDLVVNMEKDKAYFKNPMRIGIKICDLPGIKEICDWIKVVFDNHDPGVDLDSDRFSPYETLRGYSWRGKDCDDANGEVHPGAKPIDSDMVVDSNCNGIKGKDPITGNTYEDLLCSNTEPRGIALLGDSIGAHFHLPREWFNSTELSVEAFELLPFILENEFDWPELSSTTGFMNATDSMQRVIHGPTDSLYYRLWQRNHCNFRDFQNIGVNGARSGSMAETIENRSDNS